MTLTELNYIFPKAHILMGVGCVLGEIIANGQGISCPWLLGCLMGLLFSLRLYKNTLPDGVIDKRHLAAWKIIANFEYGTITYKSKG